MELDRLNAAPITGDEYIRAAARAREKLERIIAREGDAGGARRQPQYLNALIAEAIRQERYEKYTECQAVEIRDKKIADESRQPENIISYVPIVSHLA